VAKTIDYYLSLVSPWSYLGHQRLLEIATRHQATINIWPVDLSVIFPQSGGLPLPKRAPVRQAYRMQELQRWRDYLNVELVLEPAYFPTSDKLAAAMVIKLRETQADAALGLAGACLRACWVEERDIGNPDTLGAIAEENQLDASLLLADSDKALDTRTEDSKAALQRGVFGVPTFIHGEQIFWGQDRLDFLERALVASQ
jgi:carboxymethylenebutenolidase|tara:strand:+ start:958 stop:1557 length:600 start_codon:yes stop_codon:yes gene_type:complete